jgi:hypothetical protein
MKKFILLLVFLALPALALAQSDPKLGTQTILLNAVSVPTVSYPYAVIVSSVNETIWFQITTANAGTGTIYIDGSLGDEAAVKAGTATWSRILTTTQIGVFAYLQDPPPYIRVSVTPTAGALTVSVRGPGTRFRRVQ